MHENSIAGLQRPIGKLLVIGLAGLMDGEGIQTKGLTETDLLDGLPDEAGSGGDDPIDDAGK